ncbi:MAG: histidine kinase, partial [Rhodoglobus sp.]
MHTSTLAPRMVLVVTITVLACFVINVVQLVVVQGDVGRVVLAVFLSLGVIALHVGILGNPTVPASSLHARTAAIGMAVLCILGIIIFGDPWSAMTVMLTATIFVVLPWWVGVLSIPAITTAITIMTPDGSALFLYLLVFHTFFGVGFYLLGRLREAVVELDSARDELQGAALQHERLRLAQDLHDLFGLTLSAIVLKAELAKRLLGKQPERAGGELRELGGLADHTLNDLSAVTSGAVRPELDDELKTAAAVLEDAGATLNVHGDHGSLPPAVADTFALVVREAVANILRHSEATVVDIRWGRDHSGTTLIIGNDGVTASESRPDGQGHRNLLARVQERGGSLTVVGAGDHFDLVTRLPHRDTPTALGGAPRWRFLAAFAAVFTAEAALTISLIAALPHSPWMLVAAGAATVIATGLLARELTTGRDRRGRRGAVVFAAILGLTFAPILLLGDPFLGAPGVAAAAALTLLPPRIRIAAFGLILVAMPILHLAMGSIPFYAVWSAEVVIDHGLVLFAILQLSSMLRQLEATRVQLAELAVDQARLRFESELDAVLRPGLAEISAKAALANKGVHADADGAARTVDALV